MVPGQEELILLLSVAKKSLGYISSNVGLKFIGFLLIPLYTRFLTPGDYGILSITESFNGVLYIILTMGLGGAITRFYFECKGQKEIKEYLGTIFLFLLFIPLLIVFALDLAGMFFLQGSSLKLAAYFNPYIRLGMWSIYFSIFLLIPMTLTVAKGEVGRNAFFSYLQYLLSTAVVIYFVVIRKEGALGSLKGSLFSGLILAFLAICYLIPVIRLRPNLSKLKGSLKFGLPLIFHLAAHWSLNLIDRFILQWYLPLALVGIYSLGYQFGSVMTIVVMGINTAWSPVFYREAENRKDFPLFVSKMTTFIFLSIAVIALLGIFFSKEVITLIVPLQFKECYRIVPVIIMAYFFFGCYSITVIPLFYQKKTALIPLFTIISAISNIIMNIILVPHYNIMGAALATLGGYLILCLSVSIASAISWPFPYEYKKLAGILLLFLVSSSLVFPLNELGFYTAIFFKIVIILILLGYLLWQKSFLLLTARDN